MAFDHLGGQRVRPAVCFLFVILLALVAPGAGNAWAANYSARVCIEYEVQYADDWVGDFWTGTGPYDARGPYVRVIQNNNGTVIDEGYTYYSGSYTGCRSPVTMDDSIAGAYTIQVKVKNLVTQDNRTEVWDQWTLPRTTYTFNVDEAFWPLEGSGRYDFIFRGSDFGSGWQDWINVAAASSYAVEKRNGDIADELFRYYMTTNPDCTTCTLEGDGSWVGAVADVKESIVHETGHNVNYYGNGSLMTAHTYTLEQEAGSPCPGGDNWSTDSKEWRTAAAMEGFVEFYVATVWNDWTESDCEFDDKGANIVAADDCEDNAQHMVDECGGVYGSRGVAVDWLTFFWDVHTDCSTSYGDMLEIWDGANPNSWYSAIVASRLRDSALDQSLVTSTCWDGKVSLNGVDP